MFHYYIIHQRHFQFDKESEIIYFLSNILPDILLIRISAALLILRENLFI
jgi:hypothetical protein